MEFIENILIVAIYAAPVIIALQGIIWFSESDIAARLYDWMNGEPGLYEREKEESGLRQQAYRKRLSESKTE